VVLRGFYTLVVKGQQWAFIAFFPLFEDKGEMVLCIWTMRGRRLRCAALYIHQSAESAKRHCYGLFSSKEAILRLKSRRLQRTVVFR
jgi:hypothetical protein